MPAERLLAFTAACVRDMAHHQAVRTEHLAEAFRHWFGLSEFPRFGELRRACEEAGIAIDWLPATASLEGMNSWVQGQQPVIWLRRGLPAVRAETTLCHELREVIENAIKQVKCDYVGIDTHDNRSMNPKSDRFAGHLLMQSSAARDALKTVGFDFATFALHKHRSIASVVTRSQGLYPANFEGDAPVAGLWLYEAAGAAPNADLASLSVTQVAHLNGFSTDKTRRADAALASAFPTRWASALEAEVVCGAVTGHRPTVRAVGGLGLFTDRDFTTVAEPLFAREGIKQVLLTAIRNDGLGLVAPWLHRLGLSIPSAVFPHV